MVYYHSTQIYKDDKIVYDDDGPRQLPQEIKDLFYLPECVEIRRDLEKGCIDQVTPQYYKQPHIREKYV